MANGLDANTLAALGGTGQYQVTQSQLLANAQTRNRNQTARIAELEAALDAAESANSGTQTAIDTLTRQKRDLERDLGQFSTINDLLAADIAELEGQLSSGAFDTRPNTVFDRLERRWFDVFDDRTTLVIGFAGVFGGGYFTSLFVPNLRAIAVGTLFVGGASVAIAELLEGFWSGVEDVFNPFSFLKRLDPRSWF